MSIIQRKTVPHLVHQVFQIINLKGISLNDLIKAVQNSLPIRAKEAKELIENMISDCFLLVDDKFIHKIPLKLNVSIFFKCSFFYDDNLAFF